jgi:ArsR family transcriptional regulator
MTDIFDAIADSTRRQILSALASKSPLTVSELVAITAEPQPTVSKQLKTLREVGLVTTEKIGQNSFYTLDATALGEVGGWIMSLAGTASAASLEAKFGEVGEQVGSQVGSWLAAGTTWLGEKISERITIEADAEKLGKELGRRLAEAKAQAEKAAKDAEKAARIRVESTLDDVKRRFKNDHEGPQTD